MDDELTLLEDDSLTLIQEAPGDDEGGNTVDLTADDAGGNDNAENTDNADQNNADDNTEENNDDQNNTGDQENDDNFDIDDTDEGNGGNDDEEGGDEENNDTGDEGGDENKEEPEATDEEKEKNALFDRIYQNLSPAEKARMDKVLREQYKNLFVAIDGIINDTSRFPNLSDSNRVVKLLIRNLVDFKKYILAYLSEIYSTKSHLENRIKYEEFLQIYNGIESIYIDLKNNMGHEYDVFGRKTSELNHG